MFRRTHICMFKCVSNDGFNQYIWLCETNPTLYDNAQRQTRLAFMGVETTKQILIVQVTSGFSFLSIPSWHTK